MKHANTRYLRNLASATLASIGLLSSAQAGNGGDTQSVKDLSSQSILDAHCDLGQSVENWWNGDTFTGNWFGLNNPENHSGVKFFAAYEADMASNVVGGKKSTGFGYSDNFYFGAKFDLETLVNWKGATLTVSAIDRNGSNLSADRIGNYYPVQQDYGVERLSFYSINLEQKLFDDQLSVKVGRFPMTDDFATSPLYWLYQNNGIDGNPKSFFTTTAFSSYPGSVWGGRVIYKPAGTDYYIKAGLFQASDRIYDANAQGMDWGIRGRDGISAITELGWTPTFNEKPGHYWFGMYYSSMEFTRFQDGQLSPNTGGFYWHADQQVYRPIPGQDQGLTLFTNFVYQPKESVQLIPYQFACGAVYKGLIPRRPVDMTVFGFTYGKFSDDYAASVSQKAGAEKVVELGYQIALNKFTAIQPNLQGIINPYGTDNHDVLVLGCRVLVTF
ncbi:MAG: carbohydrate porin [Chthoniobacteraceae bacterium]